MSGVTWNPDAPETVGLQAFWPTQKAYALDSFTKCLAMSLDQTVSQAIGTIKVPIQSIPVRGGTYVLEVFDGESAVADPLAGIATLTARPNEDVSGYGTSTWRTQSGSGSNIYATIDDTSLSWSDYAYIRSWAETTTYAGRMNTASLSLTNKRITAVRLKAYASRSWYGATFQLGLNVGGSDYWSGIFSGLRYNFGTSRRYLHTMEWKVNPATGKPWTAANIQAFDSTDEWLMRNASGHAVYVGQAWMEVDVQSYAENRIAVGVMDDTNEALAAGGWNSVTMLTPADGTWTKDGSGRHLYTLRRTSSTGSIVIPVLSGTDTAEVHSTPVTFASGWTPTLDPSSGIATSMGDATDDIFGLIQVTTAPADSVDSIPYVEQEEALVYSGQNAEQEFSATALDFAQVRFFTKRNGATADLAVRIKRRSDNVQIGPALTVTADDVIALPDAGNNWRLVNDTLASAATLAPATQYYMEFSSNATGDSTDYWSILAYDSWDVSNALGYGGTTDQATINGAEDDRYDMPFAFSTAPTTMADGATQIVTLAVLASSSGIQVGNIEYVRCTWDPTALGANFSRYEVQRSEDAGTTWYDIGYIEDENTAQFDDIEGARNVTAYYRVRVVATSGAASTYLTCGNETPTVQGTELLFVSNWDVEGGLAFMYIPGVTYSPLDTSAVSEPYSRDGHYAFRGSERRFRKWGATLYVPEEMASDGLGGVGVFDPLEDFIAQSLPYICVMDYRGRKWYADVVVGSEEHDTENDLYTQEVAVTELVRVPVPATITAVPA